jgi:transglutaminase-like putative cysteine protease
VTNAAEQNTRQDRLPLSIAGATFTAFALLYLTSDRRHTLPLVPVLAAMLLVPCLTSWRLPSGVWYGYGMRALLFGAVLFFIGLPRDNPDYWYFKSEYTNLAGDLLAAEMVVQSWRWRDWSQPSEAAGVAVLLTALIVAAASNTYRHEIVGYLVPAYAGTLIFALRQFGMTSKPRRNISLQVMRAIAMLVALSLGYAAVESVYKFEYPLTKFAMRLFNRPNMRTEVGLSDTPYLTTVFNPRQSLERVLVIDGSLPDPHLRSIAFARYDNHGWRPTLRERDFEPMVGNELHPNASGSRCTITTLTDTAGLLLTQINDAGVDADVPIGRDQQAVLQARDAESAGQYTLISQPQFGYQGPLCVQPAGAERERLLAIPPDLDGSVLTLAREVAGNGDPLSRVKRLANELRAKNGYSLSFTPQGDPISDFVLNHRSAHCQYFASALVVMSRAVDVPARFVTGYYAHEREAGETVVRGRDAHAWAEVWIDGTGWVTMDATPSDGTPDALYTETPFWTRLYDLAGDLPRHIRRWYNQISRTMILFIAVGAVAVSALIAMIRSLAARFTGRRHRGRSRSRQYGDAPPSLQTAIRRFERAVRRSGFVLHPSRTWRESLSAAPRPYQEFVDLYDALRFGDAGDPRQLEELLAQIEGQSRKSPA